ncbi:MAG: YhbY family RNA-binding protein [Clostridia bacterium]|jgi:RNA-binding protein|nr:YhbY family RNA-binding protein [Clostridia bacterium]
MLKSSQRAKLRAMANGIDPVVIIGKDGLGANFVQAVDEALEARELIKVKLLETAPVTVREAADFAAESTGADVVQVIGTRFVLYRKRKKEPKIIV